MKKLIEKNKNILVIALLVLLLILLIIGLLIFPSNKIRKTDELYSNKYNFKKNSQEIKGTLTYTTDAIKSEHCIEGICISEVKFYYLKKRGRIDYQIVNRNTEISSGYLEADFGFVQLVIPCNNLEPGVVKTSSSYYENEKFKETNDYQLRKLTEEEVNNIIKE